MQIAIIGGRDRKLTESEIKKALPVPVQQVNSIISGGAVGVDTCAANFAKQNNINLIEIRPNYNKYGRGAPLVRNKTIIQMSNFVLAFPGNKSRGTYHSIKQAKKYNIPVSVFLPPQNQNQISLF